MLNGRFVYDALSTVFVYDLCEVSCWSLVYLHKITSSLCFSLFIHVDCGQRSLSPDSPCVI